MYRIIKGDRKSRKKVIQALGEYELQNSREWNILRRMDDTPLKIYDIK